MSGLRKLAAFVAEFGQSIQFVAFFAHLFCAAYLVEHLFGSFRARVLASVAVTLAAGVKEFWFDARYEHDPPQTFFDNAEDFVGWTLGAWLGVLSCGAW